MFPKSTHRRDGRTCDCHSPTPNPALAQWFTEPWLCRRIVRWAGVRPGWRVLEPGAGSGNFVAELVAAGAMVTAIEIDRRWVRYMRGRADCRGARIRGANFLRARLERYDLALGNPPYDDRLDARFVARSMQVAPRGVFLLRTHALHGLERYELVWRHVDLAGLVPLVSRPGFGGQHTPFYEYSVVDVRRRETFRGKPRIEHWLLEEE